MEIIPGVHTIEGLGVGRAYVYREADKVTLIDTGLAGSAGKVYAAVEGAGGRPDDIRQIVITHHHRDHIGSLADVVERTKAPVLVHALDAPVVRGDAPPPGPNATGLWKLLSPILSRDNKASDSTRVDRELQDGDEVDIDGGALVVHVPGHTAGSIALFLPKRKALFTGDAAANALGFGPPSGPFGLFNEQRENLANSFRKLAELDFEVACFGHGRPMDREASLAFRRRAEKLT